MIKRKFTTGIALVLIVGAGFLGYGKIFSNDSAVRYATAQVQNGTLIVSISGSGQVSASNQVDVKPKASGEITAVYAKLGQEVGAGLTLAAIDARDAQRAVRDAETSLETVKLELDKMLEPLDELTLLQAENSLDQAKKSKQKAEDNIKKAYEDGFNFISSAFLDLPGIMAGLENLLFANTIDPRSGGGDNITWYVNQTPIEQRDKAIRYRDDVYTAYSKARIAYTANFDSYKSASRNSDKEVIEALISETYNTSQLIADAIKTTDNYIDFVQDAMELRHLTIPSTVSTHQSNISSYTGKTNGMVVSLLSIQRSLKDSREAIVDADTTIKERELSLAKTKEGPDDLDIRAKKIDHYVRAPFAGIIAKVSAKKGDTASAGTAVATLVTKQKIAEVSLNEVDVAQVKAGQKVTLTFDAVPDLTITGQVVEVDAVGTVSQGVVTYAVKIGFDTQDDRVKTAMSVSAAIVTEAKPDVLLVPNSAVKSQGGMTYVEIPDEADMSVAAANASSAILKNSPRQQTIEIGTANDEFTEVVSGLKDGDVIVTRTIQPTTTQTTQTQQQSGGLRIPGLPGGGGGLRR
ncbi:MAG: HlyD family efflux transporter periplasmic adaptor subunit [Candidatus Wildermuthbacteria bacterium]|nr:HlyD family efflux transporter periplasmic adaptor subunit [Candidatus Wildermuthbacteria bacterium]